MGLEFEGYVLEPPRVGSANSPFTATPNNYVYNQVTYDAHFDPASGNPRVEFMVLVEDDRVSGSLIDTFFGWTKNEVVIRFDYGGQDQRFKLLPGSSPTEAGVLATDSNTNRISVSKPLSADLAAFPLRVSIASTTFIASVVLTDLDFNPALLTGQVEISMATGNLNWSPVDLAGSFVGQTVWFQQQTFFTFSESNGNLGTIGNNSLALNPIPATLQSPRLRIGYREYLVSTEVPNEGAFSPDPPAGSVEWALDTGRLKFHSGDITTYVDKPVYYDGVLVRSGILMPTQTLGLLGAPVLIAPIPAEGGDVIFIARDGSGNQVQFPETVFVDTINTTGKRGQVQIERLTGNIGFSLLDRLFYGTWIADATTCDLRLEYGIALRLYRSPVDLTGTDSTVKDAYAFYDVEGGTLADPIIQSPQIFLSALPVESLPITLNVEQGTGNWVGVLPDLNVPAPPPGYGYLIDYEDRLVQFANRIRPLLLPRYVDSGAEQLGAVLIQSNALELSLETSPGSSVFVPLILGTDAFLEPLSGTLTFVSTAGALQAEGTTAEWITLTTLQDTSQDFVAAGVVQGNYLLVLDGTTKGVYTVDTVTSNTLDTDVSAPALATGVPYEVRLPPEILVDRYFREVLLTDPDTKLEQVRTMGTISNVPRLSVDVRYVDRYRFRYDSGQFSTSVSVVTAFAPPATLPQGTAEILEATGEVNFSQDDVNAGGMVFSVLELRQQVDYTISPELGFVQYTERALTGDEGVITYVPSSADPPNPIEERVLWLVRKEISQPHPTPTNVVTFNPNGYQVTDNPIPAIFRGGRPQQNDIQVKVDAAASSVQFLDDNVVTDALPHGSVVNPIENVYIDYYIFDAVGGEQTFTVLNPPMAISQVSIEEGTDRFTLKGDRTGDFPGGYVLRIDTTQIYHIGSSSYDAGTNETTVVLTSPQKFTESFYNPPKMYVTSGPIRYFTSLLLPSYFALDTTTFDGAPRGMNVFVFHGDVSRSYAPGSILSISGATVLDMYLVQGVAFSAADNRTTLTLAAPLLRQVLPGAYTIRRSVRPIIEATTTTVLTSNTPDLDQPYEVFRRVEGQMGEILTSPLDYTIDGAGQITFTTGLAPMEEFGIFYTGFRFIEAGRRLQTTYTHIISPETQNGLVNQVLEGDYWVYAPDTFYFRVETMDNFRAELARQYEKDAKSAVPSTGPQLFNISLATRLYEQGSKSAYFDEEHLTNEDIVARLTLKFYNDFVNHLEDVLQNMDGRVVGSGNGRFRFDGNIDNPVRTSYDQVTNDIDDVFKVSPAPYQISWTPPVFSVVSIGTYQAMYLPAPSSRFFPTRRRGYGVAGLGAETGDPVLDTGYTNITGVENLRTRLAWAMSTMHYPGSGPGPDTTIDVDNPEGSAELARPAFVVGEQCVVQARNGSFIYDQLSPITVTAVGPSTIQFAGILSNTIPAGSTIYRSPIDQFGFGPPPTNDGLITHRRGIEYHWDPDEGQVLYVVPFMPYDGSFPLLPASLEAIPLRPGVALTMDVTISSSQIEPDRFPALDGEVTDDDEDVRFPIISPSFDCELSSIGGWLPLEDVLITVPGGSIDLATTMPLEDTGTMAPAGDQLTVAVPFPFPNPKQWDLVRIYDGVAWSDWRQVTAVTPTDVFVDPTVAFPFIAGPVLFQVSVAFVMATGAGAIGPANTLTDGAANFPAAGVEPGHTVVVQTGPSAGERRQVQTVATTVLVVAPPFASLGVQTYTVENPLSTYGSAPGSLYERTDGLFDVLDGEIEILDTNVASPTTIDSERVALEGAFSTVFTQKLTSVGGAVVVGLPILTDLTADFAADDVVAGDYIHIPTGPNAGVWRVAAVTSSTTLDINGVFLATEVGVSYTAESAFGATEATLIALFDILQQTEAFVQSAQAFQTLVSTQTNVLVPPGAVDPNIWSVGIREVDLLARETLLNVRSVNLTSATGFITTLVDIMTSTDRLYDRRFVWIDTRINRKDGILAKRVRAILQRIADQAQAGKQMVKLLAIT